MIRDVLDGGFDMARKQFVVGVACLIASPIGACRILVHARTQTLPLAVKTKEEWAELAAPRTVVS